MAGPLQKLAILGFSQPDYSGAAISQFNAFVNPSEIALSYEMEYDSSQGSGTTGSRMEFKSVKPGDMTLNFYIDGTGANGDIVDVQETIESFQTTTGYNGDIHRPNYLKITWGTLQVKRCVLKSATITYKMFQPDGVPLRAIIAATFTDNSDDKTRVAMAQDQSPDLTHVRLSKAGDNLPTLCYEIYGDPGYYLEVARANQIDAFRSLTPGTTLVFPPLT